MNSSGPSPRSAGAPSWKRNFLLRGFFNRRGYFDLAAISPAEYRQGVLTKGPYLDHLASGVVMIEGYAQQGTRDVQYLTARARAALVRDYLIGRFHLDPQATGAIPLGADSSGSPGEAPWDGVALAAFIPTSSFAPRQ